MRKTLGDDDAEPHYIETVPRRGYRFIAPIREPAATPSPPHKASRKITAVVAFVVLFAVAGLGWLVRRAAGPLPRMKSVAVLPLDNLSHDPTQDYFAAGTTEMLIADLTRLGTLRVIAPDSVMRSQKASYSQLARDLNVDAVVRGAVLHAGDRVRITAELIDAKTALLLWADSYDRDVHDILGMQTEIAGAIAREVDARGRATAASVRPVAPEAYQAYLKGRYCWNRRTEDSLRQAARYFEEAITNDPAYARAYTGLADSYALLGSNGYHALPPTEAMPKAKRAAQKALELDPSLAEAHASLANVILSYDWDLPKAEQEFKRAIELNPGYATAHQWYAHYFLATGDPYRALVEMKRAQDLDPLSLPINVGVGWCLYRARKYDQAVEQYQRTLRLDNNFALAHQTLGMAYEQAGRFDDAIVELERAVDLSNASASTIAVLGHACAVDGRRAEALEKLAALEQTSKSKYVPAIYFASIYIGLGDEARAREYLRKAREERSEYVIYMKIDPVFSRVATP